MISYFSPMDIEALIAENKALKAELAELKRLLYGARRERYEPQTFPGQGNLFSHTSPSSEPVQETATQESVVVSQKKTKPARKLVKRNRFPEHLERVQQVHLPQGVDIDQMTQIGSDITELLAYQPASLYVEQIIRPRLVDKQDELAGVKQAAIPPRLIPKGMVDESLVAQILVEKIQFHTPLHRFGKKLQQAGIQTISNNNLHNWFHKAAQALLPLYHHLKTDLLAQAYNQADESPIPVQTKDKPGATHRGYMWVLHNPAHQAVYFHYDPSRATSAASILLEDFQGIVQTDGYEVYDRLQKVKGFQLVHCMAHARRYFIKARDSAPQQADFFLQKVQQLYQIERKARQDQLDHHQRLALRQQQAQPILAQLHQWLSQQANSNWLPKSPIGKAVAYALKRWQGLSAYALDGQIEIDNNLIENTIRPLALGRKNYLFSGSHEAAKSLACLYSIIGTAIQHNLNTQEYLTWLLQQVATRKVDQNAINWLPHRLENKIKQQFML